MSRYTSLVSVAICVPIQNVISNVLFGYQQKFLFGFYEKKKSVFIVSELSLAKALWLIFLNIHVKKSIIHFEQNRVQWYIFRNSGKFHLKKRKYAYVFMALVAFVCSYEKNKQNRKDFELRYIHQAIFKIVNSLHTSM